MDRWTRRRVRAPFAGAVRRRRRRAPTLAGTPIADVRSQGPVEIVVRARPRWPAPRARLWAGEHGPWLAVRLTRIDGMTDYVAHAHPRLLSWTAAPRSGSSYARVRIEGPAQAATAATAAAAGTSAAACRS